MFDAHALGYCHGVLVGSDVGEEPIALLQFLHQLEDTSVVPLHGGVFVAIGDDGHQHAVALVDILAQVGDGISHRIVEGRVVSGLVIVLVQVGHLGDGHTVIDGGDTAPIEDHQTEQLFLIRVLGLGSADGLNGFHHTCDGFFADGIHGA